MLDILVILDRSGSMQDARSDHEGGLKSFVEAQRAQPGDVRFTLVQFDDVDPCEVVYDRVPIAAVQAITLVPRGSTPLLDAMGRALDHLAQYTPEEVIVMVITDGQENASTEWTQARVKARVADLEKQQHTFLYLGANVDAFAEARALGVGAASSLAFLNAPAAVASSYRSLGQNVNSYRGARARGQSVQASGQSLAFTADQRSAASGTDATDDGVPVTTTAHETNTVNPTTTRKP